MLLDPEMIRNSIRPGSGPGFEMTCKVGSRSERTRHVGSGYNSIV